MNKKEIISKLEAFAPPETQEAWDCSGWLVENSENDIRNVMYALTITDNVYNQAKKLMCDLIISHHPLFSVPVKYRDIQMYCAHTNMDKASGGTTDTLIEKLGWRAAYSENEFVRVVMLQNPLNVNQLAEKLRIISPKHRYVNNNNIKEVRSIAFCAGSGSEFINQTSADCFITGDLKYHTVCEAEKLIFDIGHFESEIFIREKFREITGVEGVLADEKSPFV